MKFKTFRNRSSGQMINYEIANVKDLVKIIHDVGNEIEKYKDVFNTKTEREGVQKAKDMFTDMMIMMADDMIHSNYAIVFPYKEFGFMYVGDVSMPDHPNYQFDIETNGKVNGLVLRLHQRLNRFNNKFYKGKFVRPLKNKVYELTKNGHAY